MIPLAIPPMPPARPPVTGEVGVAELSPRYEDVTQDGRVVLTSLTHGVGAAVWQRLLARDAAVAAFRRDGILPILRRIVVIGEPGPFSANEPITYEGTFRLGRDEAGERLFLNMWVEASARPGRTFGPPPAEDAPRVRVGRVFAEHVLTRPFAPKEARKVRRLVGFAERGLPDVPEDVFTFEPAEALVGLAGSVPLVARPADEVTFGQMHTDSNQHVNSLVYPRRVEEAAMTRLGDGALLARALELRFRKPCFAGDRVSLPLAIVHEGPALGALPGAAALAVAAFGDPAAPHATAAIWLA